MRNKLKKFLVGLLNFPFFAGLLLCLLAFSVFVSGYVPVRSAGPIYLGDDSIFFSIVFAIGGVFGLCLGLKKALSA